MEQQGHLCLHKTSHVGRNLGCCKDLGFHSTGNRLEGLEGQGRVEALTWSKWLDSEFLKAELELLRD